MFDVGARKRVYVNADANDPKILRVHAGSTLYYGSATVSASSFEGSLTVGQSAMIAQGKWLVSGGDARCSADSIAHDERVVELNAGDLGAAYSLSLGGAREVWVHGTLNANQTMTLNGVSRTAHVKLFLTQDATGGRTFTVTDSDGSLAVDVSATAESLSLVELFAKPDGTVVVRS